MTRLSKLLALCLALVALGGHAYARDHQRGKSGGAVFTMTNEADGNRLVVFERARDGSLAQPVYVATDGLGSGDSLGAQGSLVITPDRRHVLVTNPGSDDVSVFAWEDGMATLIGRYDSQGTRPISVTAAEGLVYVLNAGGDGGIAGFWLSKQGELTPIDGSQQGLSQCDTSPAQISLTMDGSAVVVTEKATQRIDSFEIDDDGRASPPQVIMAAGSTPFGFDITRHDVVVVSEAGAGALSSYAWDRDGQFGIVDGPVPDGSDAACWVAISPNDRYAFTTNAASGNISAYRIREHGELELAEAVAADTGMGSIPLDLDFDRKGAHLYVLARGARSIMSYSVAGAALEFLEMTVPLPEFTSGIASF